MKKNLLLTLSLLSVLTFLSGCVSVSSKGPNVYPKPRSDKGLVYFYRESKFGGCGVSYSIKEDGLKIGAIGNGTYFFTFAEPGNRTYCATTEIDTIKQVPVEPGKTYYIECGVEMGLLCGRPTLKIVNELEGKSALPSLKYAQ